MLVTCAIIINSQNQILVTQRSSTMHLPLKWEFPGGKIEENETPEACLIREIREELNIDIEIIEGLSPNDYQYADKFIRLIPFICKQTGGEIELKEHAEYKWLDRTNLLDLDWAAADVGVVREFLLKI